WLPCERSPSLTHLCAHVHLDREHLALWLLHGHARHDLARLYIHHGSADVIRRRTEAFFQLRPIDRLTYLQRPDLPGVRKQCLLISGVAHGCRPHLERAPWQAVALAAPERGPQRPKAWPQERRHPVAGRLIALVH